MRRTARWRPRPRARLQPPKWKESPARPGLAFPILRPLRSSVARSAVRRSGASRGPCLVDANGPSVRRCALGVNEARRRAREFAGRTSPSQHNHFGVAAYHLAPSAAVPFPSRSAFPRAMRLWRAALALRYQTVAAAFPRPRPPTSHDRLVALYRGGGKIMAAARDGKPIPRRAIDRRHPPRTRARRWGSILPPRREGRQLALTVELSSAPCRAGVSVRVRQLLC